MQGTSFAAHGQAAQLKIDMAKDEKPKKVTSQTCLYMLGALVVACCCMPAAQMLAKNAYVAGGLNCAANIITWGVVIYVFFFTHIISSWWKGGFNAVGSWQCVTIAILSMIVGVSLLCQCCLLAL